MAWITLQVTLGSGATQVSTSKTLCRQILMQNNAANVCRLGDSTVSATIGLSMNPGGAGAFNSGPVAIYNSYLSDFWLFGTAADVIDVLYNT